MELEQILTEADLAVQYAQLVRRHHRRKSVKGGMQREQDLANALIRVKSAMKPIRSKLATVPRIIPEGENQLREASYALQSERRKLWKMQKRKDKNAH